MNFIMSSIYDTKINLFYIKSAETLKETRRGEAWLRAAGVAGEIGTGGGAP